MSTEAKSGLKPIGLRLAIAGLAFVGLFGGLFLMYRGLRAGGRANALAVEPDSEQLKANWSGFRGAFGLAVAGDPLPPTEWDGESGKNILWKADVPLLGHSSPIVWGNRVFLSGATGAERAVFCYDADTGKQLWRKNVASNVRQPDVSEETGFAAHD